MRRIVAATLFLGFWPFGAREGSFRDLITAPESFMRSNATLHEGLVLCTEVQGGVELIPTTYPGATDDMPLLVRIRTDRLNAAIGRNNIITVTNGRVNGSVRKRQIQVDTENIMVTGSFEGTVPESKDCSALVAELKAKRLPLAEVIAGFLAGTGVLASELVNRPASPSK